MSVDMKQINKVLHCIYTQREICTVFLGIALYTDIAYSYRVESEASNDMEIYKHNIIHFYEMALHMDSENWRPMQYYGIYFAKMKNIEKAQEYLNKLKSIIDKKGGNYDRSGDEWYNAVNHFEKEINKAISSRLKTHKKTIVEMIDKDKSQILI